MSCIRETYHQARPMTKNIVTLGGAALLTTLALTIIGATFIYFNSSRGLRIIGLGTLSILATVDLGAILVAAGLFIYAAKGQEEGKKPHNTLLYVALEAFDSQLNDLGCSSIEKAYGVIKAKLEDSYYYPMLNPIIQIPFNQVDENGKLQKGTYDVLEDDRTSCSHVVYRDFKGTFYFLIPIEAQAKKEQILLLLTYYLKMSKN